MLKRSLLTLAFSFTLPLAIPATAQQGAAPDFAAAVSAPGRPADATALDAGRMPAQVLAFEGLKQGDHAIDLFTGSGYYGEIMARAVGPQGSVVAWNPSAFVGDEDRAKLASVHQRSPNFTAVDSAPEAISLPANSFDFAMIHLNYHDTYYTSERAHFHMEPAPFLAALFQALKPGGTFAVIDHVANPGGDTRAVVQATHRIDPATIRADFERAGFVFDGESNILRNPGDDHTKSVFDPAIRGHTDRVVYRFRKPAR
jgi:predicted methyltransferase